MAIKDGTYEVLELYDDINDFSMNIHMIKMKNLKRIKIWILIIIGKFIISADFIWQVKSKNSNVQAIIYTSINSRLLSRDIDAFNKQYGSLDVRYTTNVHDRYIIIDQRKLYHLGHSIKDLGKKIFTISFIN